MINSNRFVEETGHTNPNKEWPFHDETTAAEEVQLGMFNIRENLICQLGDIKTSEKFDEGQEWRF